MFNGVPLEEGNKCSVNKWKSIVSLFLLKPLLYLRCTSHILIIQLKKNFCPFKNRSFFSAYHIHCTQSFAPRKACMIEEGFQDGKIRCSLWLVERRITLSICGQRQCSFSLCTLAFRHGSWGGESKLSPWRKEESGSHIATTQSRPKGKWKLLGNITDFEPHSWQGRDVVWHCSYGISSSSTSSQHGYETLPNI